MAQAVKKLPAVQEIDIQNLGWEDPLENWMATHSSILAWKIPWAEEPGGLQSKGWQRARHERVTKNHRTVLRSSGRQRRAQPGLLRRFHVTQRRLAGVQGSLSQAQGVWEVHRLGEPWSQRVDMRPLSSWLAVPFMWTSCFLNHYV